MEVSVQRSDEPSRRAQWDRRLQTAGELLLAMHRHTNGVCEKASCLSCRAASFGVVPVSSRAAQRRLVHRRRLQRGPRPISAHAAAPVRRGNRGEMMDDPLAYTGPLRCDQFASTVIWTLELDGRTGST